MGSSPTFLDPVVIPLVRGECIRDVGCGWGRWGCLLRSNYFEFGLNKFPRVFGIDGDKHCIDACRALRVYEHLECALLPCDLPTKTYDTVLVSEVVEHLTTRDALRLLESCEEAARYRVIVTTPNFLCLRGGSDGPLGFNQLDQHLSMISQKELLARGYKLRGAGFSALHYFPARILAKTLKILGENDWRAIAALSYRFPKLAHTTVAFKEISRYPEDVPDHYHL
jgi:2-polyprenyl-3-methyl-5-hydroxy-6-metoxy-1,4-benzoquinol methylase